MTSSDSSSAAAVALAAAAQFEPFAACTEVLYAGLCASVSAGEAQPRLQLKRGLYFDWHVPQAACIRTPAANASAFVIMLSVAFSWQESSACMCKIEILNQYFPAEA